ncbi:MAG: inositol monophosphatase family protein [Chloroflexota bacterium]|nr:inositol monophosphatase family protein [Chloroflexota bacterium]
MPNSILTFTTALAKEAGALLKEYFPRQGLDSHLKSDNSLVTEADLAADRLIRQAIQKEYPNDGILSEEKGTVYPNGYTQVWVIDPLDGTTNFSLGLHYWGVSIARLRNGRPETAAVYFPLVDELYTAQEGQGAFLNGEPLHIRGASLNNPNSFFACCSRTYKNYRGNLPYKTRTLGSAVYHLCAVAKGAAIVAFEATPRLWDLAGGWLIVREAGGVIQTLDEKAPFPAQEGYEYEKRGFPTLAAATPQLMKESQDQLTPKTLKEKTL